MKTLSKNLIILVEISEVSDDCRLCFAEASNQIPFPIKRFFYILLPKKGLPRGYHAHIKNKQVLFCLRGKVRMIVDDGKKREEVVLKKPNIGIFLDKMIWHEMHDMDENTILLVVASEVYKQEDYIRDYRIFWKKANEKK